jgi:hypothetical protein
MAASGARQVVDLAWYPMAVAAMVNDDSRGQGSLTIKAVSEAAAGGFQFSTSFPIKIVLVLRNYLVMLLLQGSSIGLEEGRNRFGPGGGGF